MSSADPGPPPRDAPWIRGLCALFGLAVAGAIPFGFSPSAARIARARALGIVSETTLAGYDPGRDVCAYAAALAIGTLAGLALWWLWRGRKLHAEVHPREPRARTWSWWEVGVVALVLAPGLLRFDLATNGWDAHYTFFAEEGQVLAWTQTLLHGGSLGQDAYCPYGPLAVVPVAFAFALGRPSVWLWRMVFYAMQIPALLAAYILLRELARTRIAAIAGLTVLVFHRMWPMPGISWSLLRVGLGLGALALLARSVRGGSSWTLAAAGAVLGLAVATDPAAGVAAGIACAAALAIAAPRSAPGTTARRAATVAAGISVALLPIAGWFAIHGALGDLLRNLAGFSRLRVLGHGATPFPDLPARAIVFAATPSAATWADLREAIGVMFGPAVILLAAFDSGTRWLRGARDARLAVEVGLVAYGAALFVAPLTRPDTTNVVRAIPPAIILAVLLAERSLGALRVPNRPLDRVSAVALVAGLVAGTAALETDIADNVAIFARQYALDLRLHPVGAPDPGMRALDLPRSGGVRLPAYRAAELEDVARFLERNTAPAEPVWCFPAEPMINFLVDRPVAGRYPVALFAITTEQRREMIDEVERENVRTLVVNTRPISVDGIPSAQAVPELWAYVRSRFEPVARFGRYEIRRRPASYQTRTRSPGAK